MSLANFNEDGSHKVHFRGLDLVVQPGETLGEAYWKAQSQAQFEEARDKDGKWTNDGKGFNTKPDGTRSFEEKRDGIWLNRHNCPHCGAHGHEKVLVGDRIKCGNCDRSRED